MLLAILSATSIAQMASWAMAQQSAKPAARDETADRVHRVFIPVDEKEQPTKDKYQVPEQLYDELQRRVSEASGTTAGCLVRAARYQLSVSRDAMNDALVPNDVRAQFDVLVLRPDVVLRLPVIGVRSGPVALCDGREIDLEWDTDEDGFSCRFAEPGLHQLDLSLRNQRIEATLPTRSKWRFLPYRKPPATVQLPASTRRGRSSLGLRRRNLGGRRPHVVRAAWPHRPAVSAARARAAVASQPECSRRCRPLAMAASAAGFGRTARPAGYQVR